MRERRNPRTPALPPEEIARLRDVYGERRAAEIEYRERLRLQSESDLLANLKIAESILSRLRELKNNADHRWLLDEIPAFRQSWMEVSKVTLKTTQLARLLTRDQQYWPTGLATYLFGTQYVFLFESNLALALDEVLYFVRAFQTTQRLTDWTTFRQRQIRETAHSKISKLQKLGIGFYAEYTNRSLRNNLAHGHFLIDSDGALLVGANHAHRTRYNIEALTDIMDRMTDVMSTTQLVEFGVLKENFLASRA